MWCPSCERPVAARKTGRRVRNTASVAGALPTAGLSLLFAKSDGWHCPICGGPVRRTPPGARPVPADGKASGKTDDPAVVRLLDAGPKKIRTIKEIRRLTRLSLHEAKALVDVTPSEIRLPESTADKLGERLRQAGATVEVETAPAPSPEAAMPPADLAGQLARIAELHEAGALTADEFAAAKTRLLTQDRPVG